MSFPASELDKPDKMHINSLITYQGNDDTDAQFIYEIHIGMHVKCYEIVLIKIKGKLC